MLSCTQTDKYNLFEPLLKSLKKIIIKNTLKCLIMTNKYFKLVTKSK